MPARLAPRAAAVASLQRAGTPHPARQTAPEPPAATLGARSHPQDRTGRLHEPTPDAAPPVVPKLDAPTGRGIQGPGSALTTYRRRRCTEPRAPPAGRRGGARRDRSRLAPQGVSCRAPRLRLQAAGYLDLHRRGRPQRGHDTAQRRPGQADRGTAGHSGNGTPGSTGSTSSGAVIKWRSVDGQGRPGVASGRQVVLATRTGSRAAGQPAAGAPAGWAGLRGVACPRGRRPLRRPPRRSGLRGPTLVATGVFAPCCRPGTVLRRRGRAHRGAQRHHMSRNQPGVSPRPAARPGGATSGEKVGPLQSGRASEPVLSVACLLRWGSWGSARSGW
jgi:hypothetical protein